MISYKFQQLRSLLNPLSQIIALNQQLSVETLNKQLTRYSLHDNQPTAVIKPCSIDDTRAIFRYCSQNNMKYVIKGGGSNQSASSISDNIVIDFEKLNKVSIQRSLSNSLLLTIQGGVTFRQIQKCLKQYNQINQTGFTMPLGWLRNITVVGAHTILGNGSTHRLNGCGVDLIKQASIVTWDGNIITANENSNKQLLWAIKGAGPNFGAIVELKEELLAQTCDILDPNSAKQIKSYAYSFPIKSDSFCLVSSLSKLLKQFPDRIFPLICIFAKHQIQNISLFAYQFLYDRNLKQNIDDHKTEQLLQNFCAEHEGKTNVHKGYNLQSYQNLQIIQCQGNKSYYKQWGGIGTLQNLPNLMQAIIEQYQKFNFDKNDCEDVSLIAYVNYIDSSQFKKRDKSSSCWPADQNTAALIYGYISYKKRQFHGQAYDFVVGLRHKIDKYMQAGSGCDFNLLDLQNQEIGKWIYKQNYDKLKEIKQKYDPFNLFNSGMI